MQIFSTIRCKFLENKNGSQYSLYISTHFFKIKTKLLNYMNLEIPTQFFLLILNFFSEYLTQFRIENTNKTTYLCKQLYHFATFDITLHSSLNQFLTLYTWLPKYHICLIFFLSLSGFSFSILYLNNLLNLECTKVKSLDFFSFLLTFRLLVILSSLKGSNTHDTLINTKIYLHPKT